MHGWGTARARGAVRRDGCGGGQARRVVPKRRRAEQEFVGAPFEPLVGGDACLEALAKLSCRCIHCPRVACVACVCGVAGVGVSG